MHIRMHRTLFFSPCSSVVSVSACRVFPLRVCCRTLFCVVSRWLIAFFLLHGSIGISLSGRRTRVTQLMRQEKRHTSTQHTTQQQEEDNELKQHTHTHNKT